jgi:hypothetical protein
VLRYVLTAAAVIIRPLFLLRDRCVAQEACM